ncbi:hypothetical protein B1526_0499 [Bifidobacterium criceti]|uniref:Uncharacterized protein n=1 Tax=Bifidobacterium criceti TaxID=1960969 RepID=A0A2A2EGD8_9BIFI|nr:hypothetical protein B1526_0499 [Bifidobacterium criceti]
MWMGGRRRASQRPAWSKTSEYERRGKAQHQRDGNNNGHDARGIMAVPLTVLVLKVLFGAHSTQSILHPLPEPLRLCSRR